MQPLGLSYRRMLLDAELERLTSGLGGVVVEIGAKRVARGRWRPPFTRVRRWVQLNLDRGERPDVVADALALPLRDATVDGIVCVEVLQYVLSPDTAMREVARVLVPGGSVVLSVPFLHRADGPDDRHRFTARRVRELIEGAGLRVATLAPQGYLFTTVANQLRQAAAHVASRPLRWVVGAGAIPLGALLLGLDRLGHVRHSPFLSTFSTGFVAVGRKNSGS
jgi:SAM-dependent methyltransferase